MSSDTSSFPWGALAGDMAGACFGVPLAPKNEVDCMLTGPMREVIDKFGRKINERR